MNMTRFLDSKLSERSLNVLSILLILGFSAIPLLFDLPFRDNIYLSWEGAYRIYNGQMPFVDFGLPMGYAYWLLPAISFYVFGPFLYSLVKIQVFINIVSGITFFNIIKRFASDYGLVFIALFVYLLSFSFYNFWPWYNHTVIVYEFLSVGFLLFVLLSEGLRQWKWWVSIILSSFFCFFSFFTKQDGGAFAVFICGSLLLYYSLLNKDWKTLVVYILSFSVIAAIFILPLIQHDFLYWFNYGQAPHYSRINLIDFFASFFGSSFFIKLYLLLIILVVLFKSSNDTNWFKNQKFMLHLILTLGILFQATILQVTSYVPADGNIYFHSFMVFFLLCYTPYNLDYSQLKILITTMCLVLVWWSGLYWNYANRLFSSWFQTEQREGIVSSTTYTIGSDTLMLDKSTWVLSKYPEFASVKIPVECEMAIDTLVKWGQGQEVQPRVLNMSELTPLANVLDYDLEKNTPLWYHLNVGMFDRELAMFNNNIEHHYYDLVLFENLPHLNNFYPFEVREKLLENYQYWFTFVAPRELKSETIEVYVKTKNIIEPQKTTRP